MNPAACHANPYLDNRAYVMSAIRKGPLCLSTRTPTALVHHKSTLLRRDQIRTVYFSIPEGKAESRKSISAGRIHTHSNVTGRKEGIGPVLLDRIKWHDIAWRLDWTSERKPWGRLGESSQSLLSPSSSSSSTVL